MKSFIIFLLIVAIVVSFYQTFVARRDGYSTRSSRGCALFPSGPCDPMLVNLLTESGLRGSFFTGIGSSLAGHPMLIVSSGGDECPLECTLTLPLSNIHGAIYYITSLNMLNGEGKYIGSFKRDPQNLNEHPIPFVFDPSESKIVIDNVHVLNKS